MKKNLILWGTAAILVLAALYVTRYYNRNNNTAAALTPPAQAQNTTAPSTPDQSVSSSLDSSSGQKAIDFTLTDLDGNKVSLKDLKGKSVYINFWTTWCPWCKKELPDIDKVYQEYKDKGLVVLAIDIGESKDAVEKYIKENNYHFRVLLDSDQSVAGAYNISSIPVSIFVDRNGNVSAKRVGALTEDQLKSDIEALLKK